LPRVSLIETQLRVPSVIQRTRFFPILATTQLQVPRLEARQSVGLRPTQLERLSPRQVSVQVPGLERAQIPRLRVPELAIPIFRPEAPSVPRVPPFLGFFPGLGLPGRERRVTGLGALRGAYIPNLRGVYAGAPSLMNVQRFTGAELRGLAIPKPIRRRKRKK
jgi:hypothetical protein